MSDIRSRNEFAVRPPGLSREDYMREQTYRATRRPVELATSLIPDAYRSQDFLEVEQ